MGYYSRVERKRQIVWHMMNSWARYRDKRWTAKRIAVALNMARSQHLLDIISELEDAGVVTSQLEPFRSLPRRIYQPDLSGVQSSYSDVWEEFDTEKKSRNTIKINDRGGQSVMFTDWR